MRLTSILGSVSLSLMILLLSSFTVIGQVNVTRVTPDFKPGQQTGFLYSLPRTFIKLEVTVKKTENFRGPYADYAEKYVGLKNVIPSNSTEYSIQNIEMSTYAEPDPEQYYFVGLPEKLTKDSKANLLALSNSGLLLGINANGFQPNGSTVTKEVMEEEKGKASGDIMPEIFKYYADANVFEKVDTIIRKINFDTITLERQILKRTMIEKSPEQKAKEASDFISKIKENRFNLLSGYQEVNWDPGTLLYMDTQLKEMESEYLKLFTGISLEKKIKYTLIYLPAKTELNTPIVVFRFSRAKGITDVQDMSAKPVNIQVNKVGNTSEISAFVEDLGHAENNSRGFYYRIPEFADVVVTYKDEFRQTDRFLINQFGEVSYLPSNRTRIQFDPETGSLKQVDIP